MRASRRSLLLSGIAALGLPLLPVGQAQGAQAALDGIDEYQNLEAAGKLSTAKALESIRSKYGFKRGPDGRVYVKAAKGATYAVRLDMEVPGAMLFRDTSNGQVYALQTEGLQQIDLSSDQVVILLLGDGEWERAMSPISVEDDKGQTKTLTLNENDFRNVVGLISSSAQDDEQQ